MGLEHNRLALVPFTARPPGTLVDSCKHQLAEIENTNLVSQVSQSLLAILQELELTHRRLNTQGNGYMVALPSTQHFVQNKITARLVIFETDESS